MGLTALGAKVPSLQQSANLADQLQLIKDLLSAPINTLVDDSSKIKEILEQIESQLPEPLRVKLWPAGHLPFFRAEVKAAQQRKELRHSQAPLKADIAEKCKLLNQKKATLDAKANTTASTRRLSLLEKELMELEEKVRITQRGESLDCKLQTRSPRNDRADTGRVCRDKHLESTDSNRR